MGIKVGFKDNFCLLKLSCCTLYSVQFTVTVTVTVVGPVILDKSLNSNRLKKEPFKNGIKAKTISQNHKVFQLRKRLVSLNIKHVSK